MEDSSECLAAADALVGPWSLVVVTLFWDSEATFWAFLLAPRATTSLKPSPAQSSGMLLVSPTPAFPLSPALRVSFVLRAVLKKDKPLSSVLLFPRGDFNCDPAPGDERPTLGDRRLAIEELLLELRPAVFSSTPLLRRPSALAVELSLAGGPPWLTFLSDAALTREDSRLALLSAALALPEELFSPLSRGDGLL